MQRFKAGDVLRTSFLNVVELSAILTRNMYAMIPDIQRRTIENAPPAGAKKKVNALGHAKRNDEARKAYSFYYFIDLWSDYKREQNTSAVGVPCRAV